MNPYKAIIITIDRSWQSCFTCLFYRIKNVFGCIILLR